MRWSEAGYLSQFVLAHALRQVSVSLILDVRQNMKHQAKTEEWIRFASAIALATFNSTLPFFAGQGAAGALMIGTVFTTATFSIFGGRHRVQYILLASIPAFLANRVFELKEAWRVHRSTRSAGDALVAMWPDDFLYTAGALIILVGIPVAAGIFSKRISEDEKRA
jgi:hypothetical protein